MHPTNARVESFLADRNKEFSIDSLRKALHIRKSNLMTIIKDLKHHGYVKTRYENSTLYVAHIGWKAK